jgi:hypothetical protein
VLPNCIVGAKGLLLRAVAPPGGAIDPAAEKGGKLHPFTPKSVVKVAPTPESVGTPVRTPMPSSR